MPFQTAYFFEKKEDLRNQFVTVRHKENPHIFLATTYDECHGTIKGDILHIVKRQGVPLLYVIEVSSPDGEPES